MKVRLLSDGIYGNPDLVGKVFDAIERSGGIFIKGSDLNACCKKAQFLDDMGIFFHDREYEVVEDDDVQACSEPLQGSNNTIVNYNEPQSTVPIQFVHVSYNGKSEIHPAQNWIGTSSGNIESYQIGSVLYVTAKDDKDESQS